MLNFYKKCLFLLNLQKYSTKDGAKPTKTGVGKNEV